MSRPFSDWPELLSPRDVAACTGIGIVQSFELFKAKDFPLVNPASKRCKLVGKDALRRWINKEDVNQ